MEELQIFNNQKFGKLRTVEIDGEPWFVGKDVAAALGYSNPRDAIHKHVDAEDKNSVANRDGTTGNPNMTIINESGLYSLILSSKLPTAKEFKHWVTSEVIPSIRKNGGYIANQDQLTDAELLAKALIVANRTIEERQARIESLEHQAKLDRPKVIFADAVETAKTSILVGELAKILKQNGIGMGQNRLFQWLRDNGYLIKREGTDYNMPTQYSMERELFEIKETAITRPDGSTTVSKTTKVTGKGQQYFINRFLEDKL